MAIQTIYLVSWNFLEWSKGVCTLKVFTYHCCGLKSSIFFYIYWKSLLECDAIFKIWKPWMLFLVEDMSSHSYVHSKWFFIIETPYLPKPNTKSITIIIVFTMGNLVILIGPRISYELATIVSIQYLFLIMFLCLSADFASLSLMVTNSPQHHIIFPYLYLSKYTFLYLKYILFSSKLA